MDELKNDLENELIWARRRSKNAYDGMRYLRDLMDNQQKRIKTMLKELEILLADYQGTCDNFHAAQSKAIKACRDERVIKEMIKLSEEL